LARSLDIDIVGPLVEELSGLKSRVLAKDMVNKVERDKYLTQAQLGHG
jgi:hypothetical protein